MAKTDVMQDAGDVMPTTAPAAGMKWVEVDGSDNGRPTKSWQQVPVKGDAEISWGPKDGHRILNTKIPRTDGPAKATGTAIYTYDVKVPGMVYGKFVTCPYGRANIKNIDVSGALKIKGVLAALPIKSAWWSRECRYEGEPVVAVAARTMELAEDGARAVVVEYEKLQAVVTYEDAIKPGAPRVLKAAPQVASKGREAEVLAVLQTAAAVIEAEYRTPIWHHCCLETHGLVADYRGGDTATVYCSTQGTFGVASDSVKALSDKDQTVKVTSIVHHMGGGFGSKFGVGITGKWALALSKELKIPVKMMLSRREEFLAAGNGEGSVQVFKAGASKDGTLVAVHAKQWSMAGIGNSKLAGQPYQYTAEHAYTEATVCYTNEDSSVPMRAPGHPQACYAMESVMDELAYKLGMDPVEFRKKNLKDDAWHRQLDVGAKAMNWEARNKTPGKAADGGVLVRGMGCAVGAWGGGGHAACEVDVKIGQDGSVLVTSGAQDLGTGTRTYVRAIVVEELGLNLEDVLEEIGESRFGNAVQSGGSTTTASLAPAVKDAAFNARKAMAERVAPVLGAKAEEVVFADRKVSGNGKSLTWEQACKALPAAGLAARGKWQRSLASQGAHGASFAEVEVDMETGKVRVVKMCHVQDCGLPLNRLAIESQINGGMIQSMGGALYEGRVVDGDMGIMVNCSSGFLDYKLAGCLEIPELIPIIDDGDTRTGVIGMAEPANIPGVGAIANAVYNACGVRVRDLPIMPDKILMGLGKV